MGISGITAHTNRSHRKNMSLVQKTRIIVITLLCIVAMAIIFIDTALTKIETTYIDKNGSEISEQEQNIRTSPSPGKEDPPVRGGLIPIIEVANMPKEEKLPKPTFPQVDDIKIPVIPIYNKQDDISKEVAKEEAKAILPNMDREDEQIHIIVRGDTLEKLARKYYKSSFYTKPLMEYNVISHPRQLKIGMEIKIPSKDKLMKKEGKIAETKNIIRKPIRDSYQKYDSVRMENGSIKLISQSSRNTKKTYRKPVVRKAAPSKTKRSNRTSSSVVYHTVKKGETISSISKRYRISFIDIIEINNSTLRGDPHSLREGMVLIVCSKKNAHLLPLASPK